MLLGLAVRAHAQDRPNILWLTYEDAGPQLGIYADPKARTPVIDAFAQEGIVYEHASSNAPVCAPARSTIISGCYATHLGSQHMRSRARLPEEYRMLPELLREGGYYCTNNAKQDYNLELNRRIWDESSGKAHWRNREDNQPFFAVFNFTGTHESRVWPRDGTRSLVDAELAIPPAYQPDTPEVRADWTRYYDNLTRLDAWVGEKLRELDESGLADSTIVFVYADHGPGLARAKRWLYQSGLHVPLIVRFGERYQSLSPGRAGARSDRLVSFVDLAPTTLSLAGQDIPENMQGKAFLGPLSATPRTYTFGFRDRMDARYDMSRSVFDGRYKYIRNYFPHRPQAQHLQYMYRSPTTREWDRLYREGGLDAVHARFFERKPFEELYDVSADPHELHNLAPEPEMADVLDRLRTAQQGWMLGVRDAGLVPEPWLRREAGEGSEVAVMRRVPVEELLAAAELASVPDPSHIKELAGMLWHERTAIRFWGAIGLLGLGPDGAPARDGLLRALEDPSPSVRATAGEALAKLGVTDNAIRVLVQLLESDEYEGALMAAIALDELDELARPAIEPMRREAARKRRIDGINSTFITNVLRKALADLGET